jgi:mRNA-degrading endonuclease RelE of RelBE toxin-antitoxin system
MPRVVLTARARRALHLLPDLVRSSVEEALLGLSDDSREGVALRGRLTGLLRISVAAWRIIYEMRPDGTFRVLEIGHRSDVYRRDPRG